MRRSMVVLLAAGVLAVSMVSTAFAESAERPARRSLRTDGAGVKGQTILRLHAGLSGPTGDFSDGFDGGLGVGANVAYGISRSVLFSVGVGLHNFDGDGFAGDATVVPFTFNFDAILPTSGRVHPWIGGGLGLYNVDIDTGPIVVPLFGVVSASASETNLGMNFGAGFGAPAGDRGVWGVGMKYHHIFEGDTFNDLDFITLQVGYGFFL
ncbi:MAG TPA: outer membrane beta-barrel protein [Candidatus Eisenbacteria bacterium]|nr:outer membrane beta-barrel protein [Candidatus Eisenbacteria bacterium]